ncbi:MAG: hypothetical protein QNJ84_17585 [Alphaproteobacteria bacterium]|nr:hypothetical protein [Alphaproteobacteria bacterium]
MTATDRAPAQATQRFVLRQLIAAEWAAGIFGLRLFMACVAIATFMMGAVWALGDGLSTMLGRGGATFLGGDVAVTMTNVPLSEETRDAIAGLGVLSEVAELRSSAQFEDGRAAVEVKGVDALYPLYGSVRVGSARDLADVLAEEGAHPGAVVEPSLLARTGAEVGDVFRLGDRTFTIADTLILEPDRLSAGRFMVGPRVLVRLDVLQDSGLIQRGSLAEYRYRVKDEAGAPELLVEAVRALRPDYGWEFETPSDAGDVVLRTVDRTTTFLGMAGIAAFAIGLSGAWAAAKAWVRRRARTIALYRLSGATPGMVLALHAAIMAMASAAGLALGLAASAAVAAPLLEAITAWLNVAWSAADVLTQLLSVAGIFAIGLIGAGLLALSGAARIAPGAAMRSGDAPLRADPRHASIAVGFLTASLAAAALSLPIPGLAGLATLGLGVAVGLLTLAAGALARLVARRRPRSFIGGVVVQSLGDTGNTATRAIAVGIGIFGVTAIVAAQSSLTRALTDEIPDRAPALVLLDVQPAQVAAIEDRIERDPGLSGLQSSPFMRMTLTAVNGVPVEQALIRQDKSWVIEGDRSFAWSAEPTGAELLAGDWWAPDYSGPPLISPEEDLMEAFDLKVGDTMTYSVLGRSFTSEVVNIRKEYHRTMRPEFLMLASPDPFRGAPHTWIMSLQGENDIAVDSLIRDLAADYPNITAIDARRIVAQLRDVISGATFASFLIAALLVVAGALSLAALVASDVDSRRQEALVFSLVGASRREVAIARLTEAAAIGLIAAVIGGLTGGVGGYFAVTAALRIDWQPGLAALILPVALGIAASVAAGIVGGLGAAPRGRGQLIRQLTG